MAAMAPRQWGRREGKRIRRGFEGEMKDAHQALTRIGGDSIVVLDSAAVAKLIEPRWLWVGLEGCDVLGSGVEVFDDRPGIMTASESGSDFIVRL